MKQRFKQFIYPLKPRDFLELLVIAMALGIGVNLLILMAGR
jgi:hypothetical protein